MGGAKPPAFILIILIIAKLILPSHHFRTQITLYKPPDPETERKSRFSRKKMDSLEEITTFFQVTSQFEPEDKVTR